MVNRCRGKATAAGAALILLAVTVSVASAGMENARFTRVLFTQQDAVQALDLATGQGYQAGTATGEVAGTTFVEFQFAPAGPPSGDTLPITFKNKVIITDIDGDQIFFDNEGTGSFHLGIPGDDFLGTGGPLTGTYVVSGGTGKFQEWTVGSTYRYRAIFTSPPLPDKLGNVYVEISLEKKHR